MSRIDAAIIAGTITLLFLLALRPVAMAVGLVDRPGGRKAHIGIVPVTGGICMWLAMAAVLPLVGPPVPLLAPFLAATSLLVAVGAIDDRFDLSAKVRLIAQASAAFIMCLGSGMMVTDLGNLLFLGDIPLGPLALPFTVLVTISVINAFNMMDGMDGLAGGIALSSLALVVLSRLVAGGTHGLALAMVGCAVVISFLVFNFPIKYNRPVRTFMGDAGSTLLGFTVVWLGLSLAHGPEQVISPVAALWIAILPISDLFITFVRRLAKGQNPMTPDREHFHHILLRAGFSERQILGIMVLGSLVLGAVGVGAHLVGVPDGVLFLAIIAVGVLQFLAIRRAWRLSRWIKRRRRRFFGAEI